MTRLTTEQLQELADHATAAPASIAPVTCDVVVAMALEILHGRVHVAKLETAAQSAMQKADDHRCQRDELRSVIGVPVDASQADAVNAARLLHLRIAELERQQAEIRLAIGVSADVSHTNAIASVRAFHGIFLDVRREAVQLRNDSIDMKQRITELEQTVATKVTLQELAEAQLLCVQVQLDAERAKVAGLEAHNNAILLYYQVHGGDFTVRDIVDHMAVSVRSLVAEQERRMDVLRNVVSVDAVARQFTFEQCVECLNEMAADLVSTERKVEASERDRVAALAESVRVHCLLEAAEAERDAAYERGRAAASARAAEYVEGMAECSWDDASASDVLRTVAADLRRGEQDKVAVEQAAALPAPRQLSAAEMVAATSEARELRAALDRATAGMEGPTR